MQNLRFPFLLKSSLAMALGGLCLLSLAGCGSEKDPAREGRVVVKYWEKWTGFEADAMQEVVNDFNASQDRIFVDYSTVSQIDHRLILATAGGVPPDVAGIYARMLPVFAENNALTPLDKMAGAAGVKKEDYIDVFWKMCNYRQHLFALPSTPASVALIWNKKLFREAGLDPERPPQTIAELEQYNEKLLRRSPDGRLLAIGHLPEEPGWWNGMWGCWFGGELWDGNNKITANSPANLAAYQWVESYPKRFGASNLLAFRDGFGNFASPQNPFFTGRVAMIVQGVWIYNFIKNYAPPDFEWGVAAFPSVDPEHLKETAIVECDLLAVPAGAKHPKEGFEFIRYVNQQKPMEKLCLGQRKFSPLAQCSDEFFQKHPNPFIRKFLELAKSPNAHYIPVLTTWTEYTTDMQNAVGRIWAGKSTAQEALDDVQRRQQRALDKSVVRWGRVAPVLTKEWDSQ